MGMYRNSILRALAVGCFLCATLVTAAEGRKLGKAEAEELFIDVTFDHVYLPKNKKFIALDGRLEILRPNGKRDQGRTWFVNAKGQRRVTDPK